MTTIRNIKRRHSSEKDDESESKRVATEFDYISGGSSVSGIGSTSQSIVDVKKEEEFIMPDDILSPDHRGGGATNLNRMNSTVGSNGATTIVTMTPPRAPLHHGSTVGNHEDGGETTTIRETKKHNPKEYWTPAEILLLIEAYSKYRHKLENSTGKHTFWDEVEVYLRLRNVNFEKAKLEHKWRGLVATYKFVVTRMGDESFNALKFRYFNEMHALFGNATKKEAQPPKDGDSNLSSVDAIAHDWTHNEVLALIETYKSLLHYDVVEHQNIFWAEVHKAMLSKGCDIGVKHISKKLCRLKALYKKAKTNSRSRFLYFKEMADVFGENLPESTKTQVPQTKTVTSMIPQQQLQQINATSSPTLIQTPPKPLPPEIISVETRSPFPKSIVIGDKVYKVEIITTAEDDLSTDLDESVQNNPALSPQMIPPMPLLTPMPRQFIYTQNIAEEEPLQQQPQQHQQQQQQQHPPQQSPAGLIQNSLGNQTVTVNSTHNLQTVLNEIIRGNQTIEQLLTENNKLNRQRLQVERELLSVELKKLRLKADKLKLMQQQAQTKQLPTEHESLN